MPKNKPWRHPNMVILWGTLAQPPDVHATRRHGTVVHLIIATNERDAHTYGAQPKRWIERHPVMATTARLCVTASRLQVGQRVGVMGRLQTRQWYDRDGKRRAGRAVVASRFFWKRQYQIEGGRSPMPRGQQWIELFDRMKVGDSFALEPRDYAATRWGALFYRRTHPGWKYEMHSDGHGYRLWRIM